MRSEGEIGVKSHFNVCGVSFPEVAESSVLCECGRLLSLRRVKSDNGFVYACSKSEAYCVMVIDIGFFIGLC